MRISLCMTLVCAGFSAAAQTTAPAALAPAERMAEGRPETGGPRLSELFERAWTLSRQASIDAARSAELDARGRASRALFPGAPTVGLDVRRDLPPAVALPETTRSAARGRNELEPGFAAPLWLPGQRDAQQRVLERERGQLEADRRLERLRVAGQVREAAWAVALAATQWRLQEGRLDSARSLEADVARRLAAGDLAPSDRALARAEALAAEAGLLEARARHAMAAVELQRLTGSAAAGQLDEPVTGVQDASVHPGLLSAREAVATGQARLALAARTRRDNPTVSAVGRFERDVDGAPYRNTVRVGISLPLDTEARNAPRLAAVSAALTEAEVALEQRERELLAEQARARIALAAAQRVVQAQTQRADAAAQARDAIERAFRAGERALPDVLRLRAQAFEADMAREDARHQAGLAQARLHQALGLEP